MNVLDPSTILFKNMNEYYNLLFLIKSIQTGIEIGLFESLKNDFKKVSDLADELKIKVPLRNFIDLLDKLYVHGYLLRTGYFLEASYKNAHNLLVQSNPENAIARIRHLMIITEEKLPKLPKILLGQVEKKKDYFSLDFYTNDAQEENYMRSMTVLQKANFEVFAKNFDFSPYKTVIDVGGCLGALCIAIKKSHPHIDCTDYDLPLTQKHFEKYQKENGMEGKVKFHPGDFFKDESFPKSDVVIMGNILHDWDHQDKQTLFRKAFHSVNKNGIYIIIEDCLDDKRELDTRGLTNSLHMLVETSGGFNASCLEYEEYSKEAGFKYAKNLKELGGVSGVICYKE